MDIWEVLYRVFEKRESIPFDEYLEIVLYHPIHGYYSKGAGIGKEGDFYTSPHLHPIFGWTIGNFLFRLWKSWEITKNMRIIEIGAGYGYLAFDILTELTRLGSNVQYSIVEKSSNLKDFQKDLLKNKPVEWLQDLPPSIGHSIVISNELIDAFPFKRFLFDGASWQEFYVCLEDPGSLYFTTNPVVDKDLIGILKKYEPYVSPGQIVEFSLKSQEFLKKIFSRLSNSIVITIDYGDRRKTLMRRFPSGSMAVYKEHRVYKDPFLSPGNTDITYHVDFDMIIEEGLKWGVNPLYFKDQGAFLVDIGIMDVLSEMESKIRPQEEVIKMRLAVKTLIYSFGREHRVLVQGCGAGAEAWKKIKNLLGGK